ncbi:MAG: replicative DNA helicase [Bacteroidetes bacterium]|nr:replicative DNA helicase [Bacteroidota bacterium]
MVIKGCFSGEDNAIEALAVLEDYHFVNEFYRALYIGVAELMAAGRKLTPAAITERIAAHPTYCKFENQKIREAVVEYMGAFVGSWEMQKAVERMLAKRAHRDFLYNYSIAVNSIENDPEEADAAIEMLQAKLLELQMPKGAKKLVHIKEALPEVIHEIDATRKGEIEPGIPTGYKELDDLILLCPSEVTVLAARPAMGKTAFALCLAKRIAVTGSDVCIFSLEMNKKSLLKRFLSMQSGVNGVDIRTGRLNQYDMEKLRQAETELNQLGIHIDDTSYTTIAEIQNKARKLKMKSKKLTIIIDYIQLIQAKKKNSENRVQDVSEITRGIKIMAGVIDAPVIALSQLSRAVEARQNKRPMLSDLRESGSIEQDADNVMFIYRDEYYNPESEKRGEAEIIVAKQRNGLVGSVDLLYHNTQFLPKEYSREAS